MRYEYDSKLNRELAKTALDIYKKSHNIVEEEVEEESKMALTESDRQNLNNIISGLIVSYVSDTIVLTEQKAGKEFTDKEIEYLSEQILNNIDALSEEQKAEFIAELAEHYETQLLNENESN